MLFGLGFAPHIRVFAIFLILDPILGEDADLVDLSPGKMEAQKLAHNRFEKILQQNSLKGTKESFSAAAVAVVKDEKLRQYIRKLNVASSNQHFKRQLQQNLNDMKFEEQSSGGMHLVALDNGPTGDVQEKFMLFHKSDGRGKNLIVRAFFSNTGTLSENLKKLIREGKAKDFQGWLDYKLYQSIKDAVPSYVKEFSLETAMKPACGHFMSEFDSQGSAALEEGLEAAQSSGVCSSDELKPFGDKLLALQQRELQETMLKDLDEAVTEKNERRLQQLLEEAKSKSVLPEYRLAKYLQELSNLRVEAKIEEKLKQALLAKDPSCEMLLDELMQFRAESNTAQQRDRCKEITKKHQEMILNSKHEEALQTVKETLESGWEANLLQEHEQWGRALQHKSKRQQPGGEWAEQEGTNPTKNRVASPKDSKTSLNGKAVRSRMGDDTEHPRWPNFNAGAALTSDVRESSDWCMTMRSHVAAQNRLLDERCEVDLFATTKPQSKRSVSNVFNSDLWLMYLMFILGVSIHVGLAVLSLCVLYWPHRAIVQDRDGQQPKIPVAEPQNFLLIGDQAKQAQREEIKAGQIDSLVLRHLVTRP